MTRTHSEPALRRARSRARRALVFGLAVLGAVLVAVTASAGAQTDSERELDALRERQDLLAGELDALQATDAEITAALDELDARIAEQTARVAEARAAADAADANLADAQRDLRAAREAVADVERRIVEMAVSAYIHPPAADLARGLEAADLNEAVVQQTYLDVRANRDLDLLAEREAAEAAAAAAERTEAAAAGAAAQAAATAEAELVTLQADREVEAAFATEVHDRIDAALAEAAVLADLDAVVSARIEREQAALIARLPPATAAPTTQPPIPSTTLPPTTTTIAPTTTSATTVPAEPLVEVDEPIADDGASDETTEDESSEASTTDEDPATDETADDTADDAGDDDAGSPARPSTPTPPLVEVRGFRVHADIADDVAALLAAADDAGLSLGGSAYRSTERQVELRRAHCGPSDYDIWERPASQCRPPTAVPGRSLHEQGRALDFTNAGRLITSRSNEAFQWLADNAATYGLFNLPSEPWHWSTTGS